MTLDVVTLGEAMVMLVADRPGPLEAVDQFIKRTAGAETNVAIGLSRLGFHVGWVSRLGTDSLGRYLLAVMQREGIDCSRVVSDSLQRTGFLFKGRTPDGSDPPIEYHRKGSAASQIKPGDLDWPWFASARHLHATGVFPALSGNCLDTALQSLVAMREAGRSISFDPNLRPSLWASAERMRDVINELARRADLVLPGLEEGRFLTGLAAPEAIAAFYRERGVSQVAVKLGPAGAYYSGEAGEGYVAGFPVEQVVDTVGAGDGFAVGVISGLLEGCSLPDSVRRGTWIGARAVQCLGDTEGLPTRAQLLESGF